MRTALMRVVLLAEVMFVTERAVFAQSRDPGPMTERLKGILEVDPNKKFDLSKAKITGNGVGIKAQKVFEAKELQSKRFEGLKSFFARKASETDEKGAGLELQKKPFATSRYADVRKFSTETLPTVMAEADGRRFEFGRATVSPFDGKKADTARFSKVVPTPVVREAELVNRPVKPGELKSWSSSSGRVLSVEEVREILNRSK
jgi:hypothetical protein